MRIISFTVFLLSFYLGATVPTPDTDNDSRTAQSRRRFGNRRERKTSDVIHSGSPNNIDPTVSAGLIEYILRCIVERTPADLDNSTQFGVSNNTAVGEYLFGRGSEFTHERGDTSNNIHRTGVTRDNRRGPGSINPSRGSITTTSIARRNETYATKITNTGTVTEIQQTPNVHRDINVPGPIPPLGAIPDFDYPNNSNCMCPQTSGWTPEQQLEHQKDMNISGGPFDCICLWRTGYVLLQQKSPAKNRPTMDCFCPSPQGWNTEQLTLLKKQNNFSGGKNDCFCSNPSDIPVNLRPLLETRKLSPPEDQEESHLSVVSLDGNMKEVHLGALHVFLY